MNPGRGFAIAGIAEGLVEVGEGLDVWAARAEGEDAAVEIGFGEVGVEGQGAVVVAEGLVWSGRAQVLEGQRG